MTRYRWAGTLVGLILALALAAATAGIEMTDFDHFLLGLVLGLGLTAIGNLAGAIVGDNIERSRRNRTNKAWNDVLCLPTSEGRVLPVFCSVSGDRLIQVCTQTGWDEKNGCPVYNRWLRCPKYEGEQTRPVSPSTYARAYSLNADGLLPERYSGLYGSYIYQDVDYQNCHPGYVPPQPKAPRARTAKL